MADEIDLQELKSGAIDMAQRDLRGADLSGYDLSERDFSGAHLEGAVARHANFTRSILTSAHTNALNVEGATLAAVQASATVIFAVNFRGANLVGANFSRAHFTRTDLTGADLSGANFTNAVITEENIFDNCIVDEATRFDGATIFRPLARLPAFRNYRVERGRLVRVEEVAAPSEATHPNTSPPGSSASEERAALVAEIDNAVSDLTRLHPGKVTGVYGEIGHNQPPENLPFEAEQREAVIEALGTLRGEIVKEQPDRPLVEHSKEKLREAAAQIAAWSAKKAELAADAFAKQLGKSLADGRMWLGAWLLLSGKLEWIAAAVAKILGH